MSRYIHDLGELEEFDSLRAITLPQAAAMLRGRGGRPLSTFSCWRWASHDRGCAVVPGVVLVLPSVKLGGTIYLMESWVRAFEAARVKLSNEYRNRPRPQLRSPREAEMDQRRAELYLQAEGIIGTPEEKAAARKAKREATAK